MASALDDLLGAGSPPIGQRSAPLDAPAEGLAELLHRRDGFYAFESALHVLPAHSVGEHLGLDAWNSPELWRSSYDDLTDAWCFFAEDIFGGQFAIGSDGISTFDPETGDFERLASDVEGWAAAVFSDYEVLTGYPLAHEWQGRNGALPAGQRLLPKVPFVLGGEFSVDNLYAADAVVGLRYRGELSKQLQQHPDGTPITFRVVE